MACAMAAFDCACAAATLLVEADALFERSR
jgi:hypothetical protein